MSASPMRLAEVLGALSLATDLAAGLGDESALKVCLVATETARELGLTGEALRTVFEASLLRFLGCTAYAHETARLHGAGDDAAALRALSLADTASSRQVLSAAVRGLAATGSPRARIKALWNFASDRHLPKTIAIAHCEQAIYLAGQLAMSPAVLATLAQLYERYDGKGQPAGLSGTALTLPARLIHLGFRVVAHHSLLGPEETLAVVAERSGHELDPKVVEAFQRIAPELLTELGQPSVRELFLAAEPAPRAHLDGGELLRACIGFACYADMKSPYMLGHSLAVSALSATAASSLGLAEDEQTRIEMAALLHDLGRISVPAGIWAKRGPLTLAERARVERHSLETQRILSQCASLQDFALIAGMHEERLDGSGYHRGLSGSAIPLEASILAAADAYRCKLEERPYRPPLTSDAAAQHLRQLGSAGRLDLRAVQAVLEAAGHVTGRVGPELPANLSPREAEVLALAARGLSNKDIAARLVVSPRTVQNHLASVFQKTGVANRAAAALFAVRHGLIK